MLIEESHTCIHLHWTHANFPSNAQFISRFYSVFCCCIQ